MTGIRINILTKNKKKTLNKYYNCIKIKLYFNYLFCRNYILPNTIIVELFNV